MNNHQLTSRSTEMSQRSYPFINVSGEKIPPFAVMQIVGDPIYWKDYVARTDVQSVDKAFKKIANLSTNQFDNGMQLFCDKPSELSELLQDASLIAFNGDSEVGIGSGGRCFYSEYPARAAIDGLPSLTNSFAVTSGAWYLRTFSGAYGAFRAFCDTQQRVSIKTVGSGGSVTQMRVANVTSYRNARWTPNGNGSWFVRGVNQIPITNFVNQANAANGLPFADSVVFGTNPTLTLRIAGSYSFSFSADIQVAGPPVGVNVIPFRIGVEAYEEVDRDRVTSATFTSRTALPTWNLQKFIKNDDGSARPLQPSEVPDSGKEVRWARMKFYYNDSFRVSSGPARLAMLQDGSPYVYGEGSFSGMFLTDEIESLLPYLNQQFRYANNYSDYGYYAWGFGGNYGVFPPELFSGYIGRSQIAMHFFHVDDPWVTV